jgi:hypothetical protein
MLIDHVTGLFMTQAELEEAVAALHAAGFSGDEVGVLVHEA